MTEQPLTFSNGLTPEQGKALDEAIIAVSRLIRQVGELGRHRSYSFAVARLEEAKRFLQDRKNMPA